MAIKNKNLLSLAMIMLSTSIQATSYELQNSITDSEFSNTNIVDAFSSENSALSYIEQIKKEINLIHSDADAKEDKLIELARSLSYYQKTFRKGPLTEKNLLEKNS